MAFPETTRSHKLMRNQYLYWFVVWHHFWEVLRGGRWGSLRACPWSSILPQLLLFSLSACILFVLRWRCSTITVFLLSDVLPRHLMSSYCGLNLEKTWAKVKSPPLRLCWVFCHSNRKKVTNTGGHSRHNRREMQDPAMNRDVGKWQAVIFMWSGLGSTFKALNFMQILYSGRDCWSRRWIAPTQIKDP